MRVLLMASDSGNEIEFRRMKRDHHAALLFVKCTYGGGAISQPELTVCRRGPSSAKELVQDKWERLLLTAALELESNKIAYNARTFDDAPAVHSKEPGESARRRSSNCRRSRGKSRPRTSRPLQPLPARACVHRASPFQ